MEKQKRYNGNMKRVGDSSDAAWKEQEPALFLFSF